MTGMRMGGYEADGAATAELAAAVGAGAVVAGNQSPLRGPMAGAGWQF